MSDLFSSKIAGWLQAEPTDKAGIYKLGFAEHHLGNIYIRSFHGGVSASMIEICAEAETRKQLDDGADIFVVSNSIDYLRITRDADLYARAHITRISRRLCVVEVTCWQDTEDTPVVQGIVTLKIEQSASN